MDARADLEEFYRLLSLLEGRVGGKAILRDCRGSSRWPRRGVYFFFELGECRCADAEQLRVVRVGTHALKAGSRSTLWGRLRGHRGNADGGGNHRGSVFRLHAGAALLAQENRTADHPHWSVGSSAPSAIRRSEASWEQRVSAYLGQMQLLWVAVDDEPGPESYRGYVERNSIAMLSQVGRRADPASDAWLGHNSVAPAIRESVLWNVNHTADTYDPAFLQVLGGYVAEM